MRASPASAGRARLRSTRCTRRAADGGTHGAGDTHGGRGYQKTGLPFGQPPGLPAAGRAGSVNAMRTRVIQDEPERRLATSEHRPGVAGWVRGHRLTTFFVLAYVLAWWSWPLNQFDIWPRQSFNAIGALLAALIVIAIADGRPGFRDLGRRMIRWRVPWYFYAFAFGMPLLIRFGSVLVNSGPAPQWSNLAWSSFALMFLIRLVNPMDGPMAEEPAWRGF